MSTKSHVDLDKINKILSSKPFEYKDVVKEDFPKEEHTEDGKRFKNEVETGVYNNIKLEKDTGSHLLYRKLKD